VRDTPEGGAECTLQRCLPRGESCRAAEHEDAAREEGGVSGSVAVEECSRSQVVCLPYGGGGVFEWRHPSMADALAFDACSDAHGCVPVFRVEEGGVVKGG
jgi:hypothetical protein